MIDVLKKQRPASVLGLALDGNRLEGVVLRRTNGSLQIQQSFAVTLALNPLTAEPELVGREIRNHLEQAGVRERRCVVGVPVNCALTLLTEVPDLPEADVADFLALEAERGFPYGLDALFTSSVRFDLPGGKRYAMQIALPRNSVTALERALRAAQLKPASFSLGIAALRPPADPAAPGALTLLLGEESLDALVTTGHGIVALRTLDEAFASDTEPRQLSEELLARAIKITLGQLPEEFRKSVRTLRVLGRTDRVRRVAGELAPRAQAFGLAVESVDRYPEGAFPKRLPSEAPVSAALSLAANYLTGTGPGLEFLPPKVKPWRQLAGRFSSRKLGWAGAAAAALALVVGGAFAVQQWQLSRLQTRWASMEPTVRELEALQQQIKRFRPWFDDSFQALTILRKLTEAFPEEGVVTAKTLEIRDLSSVTCSGVARDNQAFLRMLDQLRATPEVTGLKVDQVRGKTPLQFTFNFHWGEPANEN